MKRRPDEYVWIAKWHASSGSFGYYIRAVQQLAAETNAPLDAIFYEAASKSWHTVDDIRSDVMRQRREPQALPPKPQEPSSFEALLEFDQAKAPQGFSRPDPEDEALSNKLRATHAARALATYASARGLEGAAPATALGDLLADLRHFCDGHGLDFAALDACGQAHYTAENARARAPKEST